MTRDGRFAVASDPDRDILWVVDLGAWALRGQVALEEGEEPGRLVEDGAGHIHVLTRRGGEVLRVDPARARLEARRRVCPSPRGVAYEPEGDALHVACEGGELVTLAASGGPPLRVLRLGAGLRDVLVGRDGLLVSHFQRAEVLQVSGEGALRGRLAPPSLPAFEENTSFEPAVGWRLVADPAGGGAVLLHQLAFAGEIRLSHTSRVHPPYAGPEATHQAEGGCGPGVVHSAMSFVGPEGTWGKDMQVALGVLPGDLAFSPSGGQVAASSAGSRRVMVGTRAWLERGAGGCAPLPEHSFELFDQPVAVAFAPGGEVLVQTRDGWSLTRLLGSGYERLALGASLPGVAGQRRFHEPSRSGLSCASCHPEGGQDGRSWWFDQPGPRRTQPLQGGLSALAPFHWDGDVADLREVLAVTLESRMGEPPPSRLELEALASWLDELPLAPPPEPEDAMAAVRGRALFESPALGCTGCHGGPRLTSNANADVGTGGSFQVPSLRRLGTRAPYLHDGRAATLAEVLGPLGGGAAHGPVSSLTPSEREELLAYLESL